MIFFKLSFSVVLPCHVSFSNANSSEGGRVVPVWCVLVFGRHCCIHADVSPVWTSPKLNPTVRLSCVFVKDATYSSENSGAKTPKANMCPVVPSNDLGGLRVTVTQVFQKVPLTSLLLLRTIGFSQANLLVFLKTDSYRKRKEKNKKKKEAINKNGPWCWLATERRPESSGTSWVLPGI